MIGYDLMSNLVQEDKIDNITPMPTAKATGVLSQDGTASAAVPNNTMKSSKPSIDELFKRYLINPGPDLIVADEAHQIKNPKARKSIILGKVKTPLRIALTGSPLQNNLIEYWCMVNWVKPFHLGLFHFCLIYRLWFD